MENDSRERKRWIRLKVALSWKETWKMFFSFNFCIVSFNNKNIYVYIYIRKWRRRDMQSKLMKLHMLRRGIRMSFSLL